MQAQNRYKERYRKGDTLCDLGKPDFNLVHVFLNTVSYYNWIIYNYR